MTPRPLTPPHLSAAIQLSTGDDDATERARRAALDALLLCKGRELGRILGVPVMDWVGCVAPACDAAAAAGGDGLPTARAEARVREGRVALVEFDGIAPQTYCNLRGRLVRGSEAARGRAAALREEQEPPPRPIAAGQVGGEERLAVYAFAPLALLDNSSE